MLPGHRGPLAKKVVPYSVGALVLVLVVTTLNAQSMMPSASGAPDFELEAYGNENYARGDVVGLSDYDGKPVVVNFWFPSCPGCVIEFPHLEKTFQKFKGDVGFFGVMALFLDTVEEGQQFVDEHDVSFALGPDQQNQILADYQVTVHPTTVFLNRDHEVARSWQGPLNAEKLEEIILELLQ